MTTLTVFTPTYNRAHTLPRTYQSLCRQTSRDFQWLVIDDGSTDGTEALVLSWIAEAKIPIRYIKKPNGGLYTGYNTAFANIDTELNVCVDSDDFMPDNAVQLIVDKWRSLPDRDSLAGIIGLDFNLRTGKPIGGYFPDGLRRCWFLELSIKGLHHGDTKLALRTDLCRQAAPQTGFPGEKNFNPVYLILKVCDRFPLEVINENLCTVEYQETDSMSAGIYRQYANSPRSFAKMRRLELSLRRNTARNRFRSAAHYVADCLLARDYRGVFRSGAPWLELLAMPFGIAAFAWIKWKNRN